MAKKNADSVKQKRSVVKITNRSKQTVVKNSNAEAEDDEKVAVDVVVHDETADEIHSVDDEEDIMEQEQEDEKEEVPDTIRNRAKQRCLVLCSRGVTARYRHLLEDIRNLLPHHKKDAKLDTGRGTGGVGRVVNEIAEIKSCNSVLFLECRKRTDCYMWLSETPQGPSAKFHISNVHTMDELRLTGNCMKGSRPVLSFDESFSRVPHLKLLRLLFIDIFGTPKGHPKSKPFVDRVMAFYYADKKVSAPLLVFYVTTDILNGVSRITNKTAYL